MKHSNPMKYGIAALPLALLIACSVPGSQTPSASASVTSPPTVLISNYNGTFSYTVDAGTSAKDVYFVFSNTSLNTSAGAATVANSVGTIKVDGSEIAASSAQPAGGPSASSASLADFRARTNRDPSLLPRSGSSASSSGAAKVGPPSFDTVGNPSTFSDTAVNDTAATCRKVVGPIALADGTSRTLNIWVADNCWSGSTKAHLITQPMVDALAAKFLSDGKTDIYAWDTAILGPEWGDTSMSQYASTLIPFPSDGQAQITILLTDIDGDNSDNGGVVGYFWDGNNFTDVTGSNKRIMFVIDAVMYANPDPNGYSSTSSKYVGGTWAATDYWAEEVFSTLAHEFQHMIQFYRKGIVVRGDGNSADTWINEMCSQLVEDLVADKLGVKGPRGVSTTTGDAGPLLNTNGRIPDFNKYLSYQLTKNYPQAYNVEDYSFSYAFGSWLMRNYGGAAFVKNVVYDPATDSACVTNAVTKATRRNETMADLLSRWAVAVLSSDRTDMPPGYRYNIGANWVSSGAGSITYNLGSINFFNYDPLPQVLASAGSVPKGKIATASNVYYQASSSLTGSKTWSLVVPQGVSFSVFVTPHTP